MAKRAWLTGWKDYPWATPIQTLINEESTRARALAADLAQRASEAADAERVKAQKEHEEALAQEHNILKAARNDVLACLVLAAEMVPSMRALSRAVAEACKPKQDGSPPDISASAAMGLLTKHALLMQRAVGAAETVLTLSRLDRGASTVNVGIQTDIPPELTYEEALEELEAAGELLDHLRANPNILPASGGRALARVNGAA